MGEWIGVGWVGRDGGGRPVAVDAARLAPTDGRGGAVRRHHPCVPPRTRDAVKALVQREAETVVLRVLEANLVCHAAAHVLRGESAEVVRKVRAVTPQTAYAPLDVNLSPRTKTVLVGSISSVL